MSKNKVKFGLSNVHYAKMITEEDGTISYAKPVPIPGAVTLSLDAEGEETPFYADNIKYYNSYANNGYSGSLEIADIPETFRTDILGEQKDSNGALTEVADAEIAPFALLYQIEGDKKGRRCVYYNTTVSRPSTEANTVEGSKDPKTDTLSITTSARNTDKKVRTILEENDTNKEAYNKFYESVYESTEAGV
ncbi:MAG: major tail protein [Clostridia bacterium]